MFINVHCYPEHPKTLSAIICYELSEQVAELVSGFNSIRIPAKYSGYNFVVRTRCAGCLPQDSLPIPYALDATVVRSSGTVVKELKCQSTE